MARCREWGASDLHLAVEQPPRCRIQGKLQEWPEGSGPLTTAESLNQIIAGIIPAGHREQLESRGSLDGALSDASGTRWRFNVFRSRANWGIALRRLENSFRSLSELGLSSALRRVVDLAHGLVIVAGPTGSGKSTTLATLIDLINHSRSGHVITLEDPIEYVHRSARCLVTQRQIGVDSPNFPQALVDALRQDPDVILVGEVRDLETIRTAITAAETGHLVLASVHAGDCVGGIERLVSVFPADEQKMIQRLLSLVLRAAVAQHLLVPIDAAAVEPAAAPSVAQTPRRRVLASELLFANSAVANLIAQGNVKQIYSVLETGAAEGMHTLDASLARLYRQRSIDESTVRSLARNPQLVLERRYPSAARV